MARAAAPGVMPVPPLPISVAARSNCECAPVLLSDRRCAYASTAWRTVYTRSTSRSLPSSPSPATSAAAGFAISAGLSGSRRLFRKICCEPGASGYRPALRARAMAPSTSRSIAASAPVSSMER